MSSIDNRLFKFTCLLGLLVGAWEGLYAQTSPQPQPTSLSRFQSTVSSGDQWQVAHAQDSEPPIEGSTASFYAVISQTWPNGFVPIYALERRGQYTLSRRPPKGQEGYTEPLFFALPLDKESKQIFVAGQWEVSAPHADGLRDDFQWELGFSESQLFGRFDQGTDYRFAFLTGGSFDGQAIRIEVEYVGSHYELTGRQESGFMSGQWRHLDEGEHGTWRAKPSAPIRLATDGFKTTALIQWKNKPSGTVLYAPIGSFDGHEWQAMEDLCRVWIRDSSRQD